MRISLIKKLFAVLGISILLYLNVSTGHYFYLGWILFLGYFWLSSAWAKYFLIKFFGFHDNRRTRVLGAFFIFVVLSWLSGVAVVFYKLTPAAVAVIFFITGLIFVSLEFWAKNTKNFYSEEGAEIKGSPFKLPSVFWGGLIFLIFIWYGFNLLYSSQTGAALVSPWQTISSNYLWVFLGTTFLLGLLIFSRLSVKTLLVFFTFYFFLQFSYLSLSHELFFGADQWRHLATEARIVSQLPLEVVQYSASQPLFLTTAPGNVFYSNFWGINVVLAQILNLDLINLVRWLMPILWALILPILIYEIGRAIELQKKESLILVWLAAFPFALQYAGALSIPNHLGILMWLFALLLMFKALRVWRWQQIIILIAFGIFSVFGYGLYSLLFWFGFVVFYLLNLKKMSGRVRPFAMGIFVILGSVSIPIVELIVKYSNWPTQVDFVAQIKQLVGNLSGWYLATGPRPHDILTGNIFFNQVPLTSFVPNFLTAHPIWIFVLMIFVWIIILLGIIAGFRSRLVVQNWLSVMFVGILNSYIFGRYFLVGQNIISRRLDAVLAVLGIIMLFVGLKWLADNWGKKLPQLFQKTCLLIFLAVFSIATTASYSLGPDINALSVDEYRGAKHVWQQSPKCVIADTYPLLVVEYLSQKKLVGGGFPMTQEFSQTERVALYEEMKNNPNSDVWIKAKQITGADVCYFIANTKDIYYNDYTYKEGKEWKIFGDVIVWKN